MPAVSERRRKHLDVLQTLPSVVANQFKKGGVPHNKQDPVYVSCCYCGKTTLKKRAHIKKYKRLYCSRECACKGYPSPTRDKARALYAEGKTIKQIAAELGVTYGTTASALYRGKSKAGGRNGNGRHATRSKLPKHCELCGYSRAVDIAHVVPVREGGTFAIENCLALCPNCHHLFDHGKLTEDELKMLDAIRRAR